jgi:hypothetical protein
MHRGLMYRITGHYSFHFDEEATGANRELTANCSPMPNRHEL